MDEAVLECLLAITLLGIIIIIYTIYVIFDEHKRLKYYNRSLYYETDWDKYSSMVVKQKKILLYKKIELIYYKILVKIKGIFVWKH